MLGHGRRGRGGSPFPPWSSLLVTVITAFFSSGSAVHDAPPSAPPATAGASTLVARFEPATLEFKQRPLCIPAQETAELINEADTELSIFSVTTDNVHFHPSLFKATTLPPGERLSITIVFLPRSIDIVEGTLVIQTSMGGFLYQIQAEGVANPYRLHPFLSAKLPAGATYSPPIQMYNPHDTTLQIKEVYTSEGFLHLNLPQGAAADQATAAKNGLWEVQPHQTKTVINVAFASESPGKYQGYVHVKTNYDTMIIPLEIIVIRGGILRTPEELHFGTLLAFSDTATLPLALLNSAETPVLVTEVYPLEPDPRLTIAFRKNTLLRPDVHTPLATLTYHGVEQGHFSGTIVARTNDSNAANANIEVAYDAAVMHGELGWFPNTTFASSGGAVSRTLTLSSRFDQPIELFSAEVTDPNFAVHDFAAGATLQPGGKLEKALRLSFTPNATDLRYKTHLTIVTNSSRPGTVPRPTLVIPISVHHGRLEYTIAAGAIDRLAGAGSCLVDGARDPSGALEDGIDFGSTATSETRLCTLRLTNPNPGRMAITGITSTLPSSGQGPTLRVVLDAVTSPTAPTLDPLGSAVIGGSLIGTGTKKDPLVVLPPGHTAVLQVELAVGNSDGAGSGKLTIATSDGESLTTRRLPLRFVTVQGSLTFSPVILRFSPSFPGLVIRKTIHAKSTFAAPLTIRSITTSDARFQPTLTNATLPPGVKVQLGYVDLDVSLAGEQDDYMSGSGGRALLPGAPTDRADLQLLVRRRQRWAALLARNAQDLRATLTIATDVVAKTTVTVRSTLQWPKVATSLQLAFGLAQIGANVPAYVSVRNRADVPVWVELVEQDTSLNLLEQLLEGEATETTARFHLVNNSAEVLRKAQLSPGAFELPCKPLPDGCGARTLAAGEEAQLGPVYFKPSSQRHVRSWLFVRSNLTLLDEVLVHGEGGSGELLFREANGSSLKSLHIAVPEKNLRCGDASKGGGAKKKASAKAGAGGSEEDGATGDDELQTRTQQSFVLANTGNLDVHVHGMRLGECSETAFDRGECACTVNGFSLPRCSKNSTIKPGETLRVQVHFEADSFSSSLASTKLTVISSLGTLCFPLEAEMPHYMLPKCQALLFQRTRAQPSEQRARMVVTAVVIVVLIAIVQMMLDELRTTHNTRIRLVSSRHSLPAATSKSAPADQAVAAANGTPATTRELANGKHAIATATKQTPPITVDPAAAASAAAAAAAAATENASDVSNVPPAAAIEKVQPAGRASPDAILPTWKQSDSPHSKPSKVELTAPAVLKPTPGVPASPPVAAQSTAARSSPATKGQSRAQAVTPNNGSNDADPARTEPAAAPEAATRGKSNSRGKADSGAEIPQRPAMLQHASSGSVDRASNGSTKSTGKDDSTGSGSTRKGTVPSPNSTSPSPRDSDGEGGGRNFKRGSGAEADVAAAGADEGAMWHDGSARDVGQGQSTNNVPLGRKAEVKTREPRERRERTDKGEKNVQVVSQPRIAQPQSAADREAIHVEATLKNAAAAAAAKEAAEVKAQQAREAEERQRDERQRREAERLAERQRREKEREERREKQARERQERERQQELARQQKQAQAQSATPTSRDRLVATNGKDARAAVRPNPSALMCDGEGGLATRRTAACAPSGAIGTPGAQGGARVPDLLAGSLEDDEPKVNVGRTSNEVSLAQQAREIEAMRLHARQAASNGADEALGGGGGGGLWDSGLGGLDALRSSGVEAVDRVHHPAAAFGGGIGAIGGSRGPGALGGIGGIGMGAVGGAGIIGGRGGAVDPWATPMDPNRGFEPNRPGMGGEPISDIRAPGQPPFAANDPFGSGSSRLDGSLFSSLPDLSLDMPSTAGHGAPGVSALGPSALGPSALGPSTLGPSALGGSLAPPREPPRASCALGGSALSGSAFGSSGLFGGSPLVATLHQPEPAPPPPQLANGGAIGGQPGVANLNNLSNSPWSDFGAQPPLGTQPQLSAPDATGQTTTAPMFNDAFGAFGTFGSFNNEKKSHQ